MNLLKETKECINQSGHKPSDIVFIGSEETGHSCTWEEYKKLSNREYHNGYGASEVAMDIIILFSDGQKMWRGEYDGSEWWDFSAPVKITKKGISIKTIFANDYGHVGWCTIEECNKYES